MFSVRCGCNTPVIPVPGWLREEDCEFQANLAYIASSRDTAFCGAVSREKEREREIKLIF
jgi:hypothetical protein